jgi:hypothetical protein
MATEKSRLEGQLSTLTSRKTDLSNKCREQFDCDITEAPALKEQFDTVAEEALTNAEKVLGLREGEPTDAPEEPVPDKPAEEKAVRKPVRKPVVPTSDDDEDEDGLGL